MYWHDRLATWCERGLLEQIWQDAKESSEQERRIYARHHYIAHLYYAHRWSDLFEILDKGTYGLAKERYDISTRSYIQDLDYGRRAACGSETFEEGLNALPHLWRYTLLRCSLRSRADQYPLELFQLLLALNREQEALGYAEWLTDPVHKVAVFQTIAEHLARQATRRAESQQLSLRAYKIAHSTTDSYQQVLALGVLASALAEAQRWEQAEPIWKQAEQVACSITESNQQAWALQALAGSLANAQRWEQAEQVARSITDIDQQAWALQALAGALAKAQRWEQAEQVAYSITDSYQQAQGLQALASALVQAQRWEQAEPIWKQATQVACSITDSDQQSQALQDLVRALLKIGDYKGVLGLVQRSWLQVETRESAFQNFSLALGIISLKPEMGYILYEAFQSVNTFLHN